MSGTQIEGSSLTQGSVVNSAPQVTVGLAKARVDQAHFLPCRPDWFFYSSRGCHFLQFSPFFPSLLCLIKDANTSCGVSLHSLQNLLHPWSHNHPTGQSGTICSAISNKKTEVKICHVTHKYPGNQVRDSRFKHRSALLLSPYSSLSFPFLLAFIFRSKIYMHKNSEIIL